MRLCERIEGGLVGDALGVPYEFHPASALPPRAQLGLVPPPGFARSHAAVAPGTWSDDGAQALCLAASLLHTGEFAAEDFARRLVNWCEWGDLAVDGQVFDVGVQTAAALRSIAAGGPSLQPAPRDNAGLGNGALMRALPLALLYTGDDAALVRDARLSSRVTHPHVRSQLCCALYLVMAAGSYESVVRAAVALGDDTDTTAAIAGGVAGLRDGLAAIPARWREALRGRELLDPILDGLRARAG